MLVIQNKEYALQQSISFLALSRLQTIQYENSHIKIKRTKHVSKQGEQNS